MHQRSAMFPLMSGLVLGALLALGACGEAGPPPGSAPPVASAGAPVDGAAAAGGETLARCGASGLIRYVGKPLVLRGEAVPEHGGYLHWEDLPPRTRVVRPGMMTTMEHVPDRLTIHLDDAGLIRRLTCG